MAKSGTTNISGGGVYSEDTTVTTAQVLEGYNTVTKTSDDEVVAGTMKNLTNRTKITHSSSNGTKVILGDTAFVTPNSDGTTRAQIRYNGDEGFITPNTIIGIPQSTMASAGGLTAAKLLKGQSAFGIGGTATSDANATAAYIYSGKTAYVNGSKLTGTMTVGSVVSFSVAAYSPTQFTCTWKWPSKGPYSGVIIRGKLGGYPTNAWDGQLVYQGTGNNAALGATSTVIIGGAQEGGSGTTYYFRIWVYCTCSAGDMYSGYLQGTATTRGRGQQIFTSSGTFTVPANTSSIDVFCVGGGGYGGKYTSASDGHWSGGSGGGGGYTQYMKGISVSQGQQFAVTVGVGGRYNVLPPGASSISSNYGKGGQSSFGQLAIAEGGGRGISMSSTSLSVPRGANGGSGGGCGSRVYFDADGNSSDPFPPGNGGADGSDGQSVYNDRNGRHDKVGTGGTGQGRTTRAFGESGGTLYSGGGAGSGYYRTDASGGAGGGGNPNAPGATNTGGGGGGCSVSVKGTDGGSGIVIVRWGY